MKSYLSRRDFIKVSAMAFTAANLPGTMGCSRYRPRQECLNEDIIQRELAKGRQVFERSLIGGINVRNRIIRSATTLGLADDYGRPIEALEERYVELAQGGVGAIITGVVGIQQNGRLHIPHALMIDKDEYIQDYRRVTEIVHKHNTPIILQIGHNGCQTRSIITGQEKVAPSSIKHWYYNETVPRALAESEIREIIDNFIRAIDRARKAGFDGVQLHGAHGYLLSSFLSLHTNRRDDRWGGPLENRFRILKEIYEGARKKVGHYPILIKISAFDNQRNGMRVGEAVQIASLLQDVGCDAVEVSCGAGKEFMFAMRGPEIPIDPVLEYSFRYKEKSAVTKGMLRLTAPLLIKKYKPVENYNVCAAQEIKRHVDIPVIVVGGIRKMSDMHRIIATGSADYIAMSRPFIIEPDIVNRLKTGEQTRSECLSCSYCIVSLEESPARCFYGDLQARSQPERSSEEDPWYIYNRGSLNLDS